MGRLSGTQTEKNLLKAFAGESQAKNRYTYFAKVAKTEGYVHISNLFLATALQEESHAKRFFKLLDSGEALEITAMYPAGKLGTTLENLHAAAKGEEEEYSVLYPAFAQVAEQEGFRDVAALFKLIAQAEKEHAARYGALARHIEAGTLFKRDEVTRWHCIKCGYIVEAYEAPELCPACLHPRAYFEVAYDRY